MDYSQLVLNHFFLVRHPPSILCTCRGFVVAQQEGLDVKDPAQKSVLEQLLKQLKQDTNWDLTDPRQKAFSDLGEVRYFYAKENLAKWEAELNKEVKIDRSSESKSRTLALEGPDAPPEALEF